MNFLMASLIGGTVMDYDLVSGNPARYSRTETSAAQNFGLEPGPNVPHPGYASASGM